MKAEAAAHLIEALRGQGYDIVFQDPAADFLQAVQHIHWDRRLKISGRTRRPRSEAIKHGCAARGLRIKSLLLCYQIRALDVGYCRSVRTSPRFAAGPCRLLTGRTGADEQTTSKQA
jgi:hypothetical protein